MAPTLSSTIYLPVTLGTSVGITEVVTIPGSEVPVTLPGSTVFTTGTFTTKATVTAGPTPSTTASAPQQVSSGGAAPTKKPMLYAAAGAMALLALV